MPGIQILADQVVAQPQQALTDAGCPTLLLVQYLRSHGWKRDPRGASVHTDGQLVCDNRGGPAKKFYFLCLLDLPK